MSLVLWSATSWVLMAQVEFSDKYESPSGMVAGQVSQVSPSNVPRTSNAFSRRSKAIFLARIQNTGGIRDGNESENDVDWAVLLSGRWLSTAENLTPPSKPTGESASVQPAAKPPSSRCLFLRPAGTTRRRRVPEGQTNEALPCWAFYALCPVSPCVTVPRPRRLSMPGHWSAER